ncbi:hypothetical protein GCM10011611_18480 [Aliidongia dinghuensis]|uniref:UPF0235 protein GCM10011611_18480 n=1 Tax=Aliidongia dinghuensis TaxID=1867774 RepID=A0A8J2YS68_9PROT|nr:DUF167 family protein [Aliidongia dinghuensis]GGF13094.1 hypothetical protein GCM10011611_18480 [Aliidongia dinghuensis]
MIGTASPESPREASSALILTTEGIRLRVRVKPGASRQVVLGRSRLSDGAAVVVIAVSAPPEGGKANEAVVALLAKLWGVPRSRIAIRVGATSRTKLLEVEGDPTTLASRLSQWLLTLPEV